MTDQTALDFAARDRVLTAHQRKALVRWLEWRLYDLGCWLGPGDFAAKSVNDARKILAAEGIVVKDLRMLGGLFPPSRWEQEGWTKSIGEYAKGGKHGRKIQTFRPKPGIIIEPVPRPEGV